MRKVRINEDNSFSRMSFLREKFGLFDKLAVFLLSGDKNEKGTAGNGIRARIATGERGASGVFPEVDRHSGIGPCGYIAIGRRPSCQ